VLLRTLKWAQEEKNGGKGELKYEERWKLCKQKEGEITDTRREEG